MLSTSAYNQRPFRGPRQSCHSMICARRHSKLSHLDSDLSGGEIGKTPETWSIGILCKSCVPVWLVRDIPKHQGVVSLHGGTLVSPRLHSH